ncbi:hypothetical protein TSUD_239100 [Trifolium subterraneum]|uniref:Uncharacterized protein n=1 Tax=Trifolium subterraneum TaxID=3900 RepID=A0A2Z6NMV3_TRISU|nr:hypothetical protein TSUD_239100 [Trifolium subterraneum]
MAANQPLLTCYGHLIKVLFRIAEPRLEFVNAVPLSMKSSASLAVEASLWQHMPLLYLLHNQQNVTKLRHEVVYFTCMHCISPFLSINMKPPLVLNNC